MKLKATTRWTTREGKVRRIRLYSAWANMRGRIAGWQECGSGGKMWKDFPCFFTGWKEFREWSIKNGYSKERCSLDRKDNYPGYGPDVCEWVTVAQNSSKSHGRKQGKNGCKCFKCRKV